MLGSCCRTCGRFGSRRHRDDVVVGDGADLADRLGDDQVRRQLRQTFLVEAVEGPAFADHLLDGGIDLSRVEPLRQDGRGQVRQLGRRGWVVALVGDADDAVAEAEREEHLRRRGNEADDPHRLNMAVTTYKSSPVCGDDL